MADPDLVGSERDPTPYGRLPNASRDSPFQSSIGVQHLRFDPSWMDAVLMSGVKPKDARAYVEAQLAKLATVSHETETSLE